MDMEHASTTPYIQIKEESEDEVFNPNTFYPDYAYSSDDSSSVHQQEEEPQIPILSKDIIRNILWYVDDVNTLRNFSLVSKEYYYGSEICPGMVVRTCLMSGGKAKKTMDRMYPLIQKRSIYPPSARRLLELATGKFCEICNNEVRYSRNNSVKIVRQPYGIHACWRCVTKRRLSGRVIKKGSRFDSNMFAYNVVLDHERNAVKRYGERILDLGSADAQIEWAMDHNLHVKENVVTDVHNYMWDKPYTDPHGRKAGPIMTRSHALILIARLRNLRQPNEDTGNLLNEMKFEVERFLSEDIQAPSENHVHYLEFEHHYHYLIQEADFIEQKKKILALEAKTEASHKWRMKKIRNAQKLLDKIVSRVTIPKVESLNLLKDYKMNMNFVNKTRFRTPLGKSIPLLMSYRWVHNILKEALKSPTKCTVRMIAELALSIDRGYKDGSDEHNANDRLIVQDQSHLVHMYRYVGASEYREFHDGQSWPWRRQWIGYNRWGEDNGWLM